MEGSSAWHPTSPAMWLKELLERVESPVSPKSEDFCGEACAAWKAATGYACGFHETPKQQTTTKGKGIGASWGFSKGAKARRQLGR